VASQLSPRQREILDLVAEGRTSKEIAVTLGISESTVNWHLANAFERLGASSRAEAVALAIRSNGAKPAAARPAQVSPAPASMAWPRLVAIAIAIAIAGALLGGATVATFHLGQAPVPTASPENRSGGSATSAPRSSSGPEAVGGETGPVGSAEPAPDATGAPLPVPSTLAPLPVLSAPTLPAVPVTLPPAVLPTLPVTPPPLPGPSLPPLPSLPIPTPTLPIP
jgi:DNA-binding CsgD family transcriptional regulator